MSKLTSFLRRPACLIGIAPRTGAGSDSRLGILRGAWLARPLLLALTVALAPACISKTPPGVFIDSEPPGALLFVDDRESGYVTPCNLHLDEGDDHVIRLEFPGYEPAELELLRDRDVGFISWRQGSTETTGFFTPLKLPFWDLVAPFRTDRGLSPGRIFARLVPLEDQ